MKRRSLIREEIDGFNEFGFILAEMELQFKDCDYEPAMREELALLAKDHKGYFESQSAPSGAAWAPNAPSTVARKGHSRVLFESGDLLASLVNPDDANAIAAASHRGLLFGTSVEYSGVHQDGPKNKRYPARPHVGLTNERLEHITETVADVAVDSLKVRI